MHKLLPHGVLIQLTVQKQSIQTKALLKMNANIMALVITPVVHVLAAGQQGAKRALPSSSPTVINEEG